MTEELMKLTPKELKKLHEAVAILSKAYHVSETDIDMAVSYVHMFDRLFRIVKGLQSEVSVLSEALGKKADEETRKAVEEAEAELAKAPLYMDLGNV